jgi:hypothetical protein
MQTGDFAPTLGILFAELVDGPPQRGGAFMLNSGDAGLKSLDRLSAADASQSANGGATVAAHVQHVRYGLSLMNRWAREGGNPPITLEPSVRLIRKLEDPGRERSSVLSLGTRSD